MTYEDKARAIGTEHGRNAASWVELDEATAEAIDDAQNVYDVLEPSSPLSGEWADGYSVEALFDDAVGRSMRPIEDGDFAYDLATAYEDAYWRAFEAEVERQVELFRGPSLDLNEGEAYLVDGWGSGIAFRYVGQTFGGKARMVMVGDDREHLIDPEDITTLGEDDYCRECGQVGCAADGRDRSES